MGCLDHSIPSVGNTTMNCSVYCEAQVRLLYCLRKLWRTSLGYGTWQVEYLTLASKVKYVTWHVLEYTREPLPPNRTARWLSNLKNAWDPSWSGLNAFCLNAFCPMGPPIYLQKKVHNVYHQEWQVCNFWPAKDIILQALTFTISIPNQALRIIMPWCAHAQARCTVVCLFVCICVSVCVDRYSRSGWIKCK